MAKTCSNGHFLQRCVKGPDMINFCDGCHKRSIRAPEHVFRCEQCNFDLCQQCYVPEEYVKGEHVMIFSKGQDKWQHGNILEVFRSACVYEGQHITAGTLFVAYSSGQKLKFVPVEEVRTCVRKAGVITQDPAAAPDLRMGTILQHSPPRTTDVEANTQPFATAPDTPPVSKDVGSGAQDPGAASHLRIGASWHHSPPGSTDVEANTQPCATALNTPPVSMEVGTSTQDPAAAPHLRMGTIWHHSPPGPTDVEANTQPCATALSTSPVSMEVGTSTQDPAAAPHLRMGTIWHHSPPIPQNQ